MNIFKKEDLSKLSTQLLEEKHHRSKKTFQLFMVILIAIATTMFVVIYLEPTRASFGGILAVFASITSIYGQQTKNLKKELEKRKVAFS